MHKKIILLSVIILQLFACEQAKEKVSVENKVQKPLGRIINDSIQPPIVISLTGANAPKVIKAAKPIKVPLQNFDGFEHPNAITYTIADGLPKDDATAQAVDREGNMWFSTFGNGICKFDGVNFTNFTRKNGLSSDSVGKIFVDSRNNIWIGSWGKVDIFDGKVFRHVIFGDSSMMVNYGLSIFFEDHQGTVWYSRYNYNKNESELYSYQNGSINNYPNISSQLANKQITKILEDKNFNLILSIDSIPAIGQPSLAYYFNYLFDGKVLQPLTKIPSYNGKAPSLVYCDTKGDIWFCEQTSGILGKFDGNKSYLFALNKSIQKQIKNSSIKMIEDHEGNYLIATSDSIYKFNGIRFESFKKLAYSWTLFDLHRTLFAKDSLGNMWINEREISTSKIAVPLISTLENQEKITLGRKMGFGTTFTIDKFNNKWIGNSKGLGKYERGYIYYYGKELLDSGKFILSVYTDRLGNIWFNIIDIKTFINELVKFDGEQFTIYGKKQGLDLGFVVSVDEDSEHNIWLSGMGGIVKITNTNTTKFGIRQGFKGQGYTRTYQDRKNKYWFAGEGNLISMDGKETRLYDQRDGLDSNTSINDLIEDEFGNIWLATDNGVVLFNGKTFTKYPPTTGLDKSVGDVISDTINHQLWFSTLLGIASVSNDEINKPIPFVNHYNRKTGFDINTPSQKSMKIDRQGNIWWNNGFKQYRFNYPAIKQQKLYPVTIKNILLDNKNVSWVSLLVDQKKGRGMDSLSVLNETALKFNKNLTKEETKLMLKEFGGIRFDSIVGSDFIPMNLKLPFKNNNIRFEFASLSLSFVKYTKYQYLLEGFDKDWSSLSTKTEASFGNMYEGDYTFRVKSLDVLGNWSETSYTFTVLPPWYRTWWAYTLYALLFLGGLRIFSKWRERRLNYEKEQLQNKVEERTVELKKKSDELEYSLADLKSTQTQLIQSEKMASLGELTAGIAHEIQNPLNFVNNFSEVSTELVDEMNEEIDKGNLTDAKDIANDLKQNLEKINHHGKRAGDIVKGMLQHSRSSSGVKEPTDINALADEYLRLAYHGLRAKDKSFNATMKTEFDESIGKINIISQDIGRVILNLITNAFYVVNEKQKVEGERLKAEGKQYEPTIEVSTKRVNEKIEVKVKDNGNGIPPKILDKIFQPFFTTKPTGQGTGLGLSLSYDIVKAHGGELRVETKEGEGTVFIIVLPV
jgi:signal transduction histidine kinase/ligand-binding sensor domain-containing protein